VGSFGRNLRDDVQLIQIMLNRAIRKQADELEFWTKADKSHPDAYTPRMVSHAKDELVVGKSGATIGPLQVDGICGTKTIAAIVAFQQAQKRINGAAGPVDGTINAIGNPGRDTWAVKKHAFHVTDGSTWEWMDDERFYSMYLLCIKSSDANNKPLGVLEINVEPLKSNLLRSIRK